jgi:N-acetylglucosaminyldiphosphoundecaprenol N-acetyl-beta-D-mannosaminyltransferase
MNKLFILGTKINDLSLDETINEINTHLEKDLKGFIVTPNPEICLLGYKDKFFRRIIKKSFISIPDGFGLKIGAFIFGKKLNNTTTGADLTRKLFKLAEQNNYSTLFFEGRPKIADKALNNIKQNYPHLKINFIDPGKIDNKGNFENKNLIQKINQYSPDIIFVNFGAPKQEYFIDNNIDKLNTKLMLGIGGSFDFIAGRLKRAPNLFRKLGLEWLWRLFQEPTRWSRIFKAVIMFPLACVRFRFGNLFFYRNNVAGFIINRDKKILIAKHPTRHYWQLPQGGAKKAKTKKEYEIAIMREIKQEIGTDKVKILDWLPNCYTYKWPKIDSSWDQFKGQKQSLFLLKFQGKDDEIILDPNEFIEWQWVSQQEILDQVPDFKKPLIQIGLDNFKKYL